MNHTLSLLSSLLVPLLLMVCALAAQAEDHPVMAADDVVDRIGVNTHLGYGDTVYGSRWDDVIRVRLLESGIRHIRDSCVLGNGTVAERYADLGRNGIRVLAIADFRLKGLEHPTPAIMEAMVTATGKAITAFEGPNEYDSQKERDPEWANRLRTYQRELAEAVRGSPAIAALPVYGPSLIHPGSYRELGDLSPWCDAANIHHYQGGREPETRGWGDDGYGSLDWAKRNLAMPQHSTRGVVTECGYHTALGSRGGHRPVPEVNHARYIPRMLLHYSQAPWIDRAYIYEFVDTFASDDKATDPEAHFGLIRNDGTPKPAYHAVTHLIRLYADPGERFTPRQLPFQAKGGGDVLRTHVAQKRDGTWLLALCLGSPGWDPNHLRAIDVAPQIVELRLGVRVASARAHRFGDDGQASDEPLALADGVLRVMVDDRLVVVALAGRPPAVTGASSPAMASAPRPARSLPSADVQAQWKDRLYAQLQAALAAGAKPAFTPVLLGKRAIIEEASDAHQVSLRAGSSVLTIAWDQLAITPMERADLAMAVCRTADPASAAVAAFHLLLAGRSVDASTWLMFAEGREALEISFR